AGAPGPGPAAGAPGPGPAAGALGPGPAAGAPGPGQAARAGAGWRRRSSPPDPDPPPTVGFWLGPGDGPGAVPGSTFRPGRQNSLRGQDGRAEGIRGAPFVAARTRRG